MRITFVGGGTDFPGFFRNHEGATLSATINKYVFVITNQQPSFVRDKFRFTYRKTESVDSIKKIQHPVVRTVMDRMLWEEPLNIATMADLPGESGLGSSSAFTAALIQNLHFRKSIEIHGNALARESIHVERELLEEPGGWQDQLSTTFAGIRMYSYYGSDFSVNKNILTEENLRYFGPRMILVRVPNTRKRTTPARANQTFIEKHADAGFLKELSSKTKEVWNSLNASKSPEDQFKILQEAIVFSWTQKSSWGNHIDTNHTAQMMRELKSLGVKSMKLLGAGGGGFVLVAEEPEIIQNIKSSMNQNQLVDFEMHSNSVRTYTHV